MKLAGKVAAITGGARGIGHSTAFLASDEASYINGAVIGVDGGMTL